MEILSDTYLLLEHKLNNDPKLQDYVLQLLKQYAKQIYFTERAQSHTTYCGDFYIPVSITKNLMKIIGVSKDKLIKDTFEMVKSNYNSEQFKNTHLYHDEFYISLLYFYLWAVRNVKDKKKLQDFQFTILSIIYARLWNGRIRKYYKIKCDDKYASYVQQLVLDNKSKLKQYRTPTDIIFNYFLGQHVSYGEGLDLAHNPQKLNQFLYLIWSKLNAIFRRVSKEYYKAYKEGKSITVDSSVSKNKNDEGKERELIEKNQTLKHEVDEAVEQIKDYFMYSNASEKVPENLERLFRATPYMLPKDAIDKMYHEMFENDDVIDMTTDIASFLLDYIIIKGKLTNVDQICKAGILNNLVHSVISSRRNEKLKNFKNKMDEVIKRIYKISDMSKLGSIPNQIKYRKMYLIFVVNIIAKNICKRYLNL